jgi:hypothetical protein
MLKRIKQVLRENDPIGGARDEWDTIACWIASLALRDDSASLQDELAAIFREYVGIPVPAERWQPIEKLIWQAMSEYRAE